MRMRPQSVHARVAVYLLFASISTFAIAIGTYAVLGNGVVPILLIWVVIVGIGQFAYVTCPHCGSVATITPEGVATPFVGDKCRYCGKKY
jgi:hypothetical protein